jgi:hypothetical protein
MVTLGQPEGGKIQAPLFIFLNVTSTLKGNPEGLA